MICVGVRVWYIVMIWDPFLTPNLEGVGDDSVSWDKSKDSVEDICGCCSIKTWLDL